MAITLAGLVYVRSTGLRGQPESGPIETRVARAIRGLAIPSEIKARTNPLAASDALTPGLTSEQLSAGEAEYAALRDAGKKRVPVPATQTTMKRFETLLGKRDLGRAKLVGWPILAWIGVYLLDFLDHPFGTAHDEDTMPLAIILALAAFLAAGVKLLAAGGRLKKFLKSLTEPA